MARNREFVKPVESQSESSEEENDEGSSEEVDSQESDSEPEQTQAASVNKSQPQMGAKSQPQMSAKSQQAPAPSSSDEEESGSESESESDGPDSNARPPLSKPNAPEPVTPTKSAAAKRPAADTAANDAKKSKKTAEPETSEKKSNLFQRLWSEDDEIVILKGMTEYKSKNKSDPMSDMNAFHDFIKKSLHIDVTKVQLQDKIRRLKKKYENNKSKEKEGKERTFSKPHEQKAYELSILIWGNGSGKVNGGAKVVASPKANGSVARKTTSKKVNAEEVKAEEVKDVKNAVVVSGQGLSKRLNSTFVGATTEERMLIAGGEYFGLGQGLDKEEDWQKLRVEELQLYQKQLEVRVAQTKLVLDVMKGKDQ